MRDGPRSRDSAARRDFRYHHHGARKNFRCRHLPWTQEWEGGLRHVVVLVLGRIPSGAEPLATAREPPRPVRTAGGGPEVFWCQQSLGPPPHASPRVATPRKRCGERRWKSHQQGRKQLARYVLPVQSCSPCEAEETFHGPPLHRRGPCGDTVPPVPPLNWLFSVALGLSSFV